MDRHCVILETLNDVKMLESKRGADGLMRLEGVFGVCGVKNNNGRIYEAKNYAAMVTEMQHRIETEGCPGELEHPNTMNITLENVSHKIESINIDENGVVTGTIVLLNTPKGQIAQSIVEGGLPLFISSRARGTVDRNGKVTLEELKTYDLVGTPGFSQARLELAKGQAFESLNENLGIIYDESEDINEEKEKEENNMETVQLESKINNLIDQYHDLYESYLDLTKKYAALTESLASTEDTPAGLTNEDVKETIKDYCFETLAPALQNWVVEEFAPEVQNWVVEEFAPEVQNWVVEEFAPEVQNWVVEEYTPAVDNWVSNELVPSLKESLTTEAEETKANIKESKLSSIDSILNLLESRKDAKAETAAEPKEGIYECLAAVKGMPAEYRPKWEMASDIVKESIASKSKMYDFSKDGVMESFWEKVDFSEPKAIVNENKVITFNAEDRLRASLRATGKKLGLRD